MLETIGFIWLFGMAVIFLFTEEDRWAHIVAWPLAAIVQVLRSKE